MAIGYACLKSLHLSMQPRTCPVIAGGSFTKFRRTKKHVSWQLRLTYLGHTGKLLF